MSSHLIPQSQRTQTPKLSTNSSYLHPHQPRQSLSQAVRPSPHIKSCLCDILEESDNAIVRYGGSLLKSYDQFGGPSCRWALSLEETSKDGEETENHITGGTDKLRLFSCRKKGQRDKGTIIDCADQEVALFHEGAVSQWLQLRRVWFNKRPHFLTHRYSHQASW